MKKKKLLVPIVVVILLFILLNALSGPNPTQKNSTTNSANNVAPTKNFPKQNSSTIATTPPVKKDEPPPLVPTDPIKESVPATEFKNEPVKETVSVVSTDVSKEERLISDSSSQETKTEPVKEEPKTEEQKENLNELLENLEADTKEEPEETTTSQPEDSPTLIFVLGDAEVSIVATGEPLEGTITYGEPDVTVTEGIFVFNSPEKSPSTFIFKNPQRIGVAKLPVTFTPVLGNPVTNIYSIEVVPVSTLSFDPVSSILFTLGDPDLTVQVQANEVSGEITYGEVDLGETEGRVRYGRSRHHQSSFTFGSPKKPGIVKIPVTFTPKKGNAVTAIYELRVIPKAKLNFHKTSNQ